MLLASPKNLSMALSVEASELVEIFQWLKESELKKVDKEKVADEIADIFFTYFEFLKRWTLI